MDELFLRETIEGRAKEMRAEVARNRMAGEVRASRRRAVVEAAGGSVAFFARLCGFFVRAEVWNKERTGNCGSREVWCA